MMTRNRGDDTYIFSKDMLSVYKYVIPIVGIVLCFFAFIFLWYPICYHENWGPHLLCTVFFAAIGMFCIISSKRFLKIAGVQYALSEDSAINYGTITNTASRHLPLFTTLFPLELNVKGVLFKLPVYFISNTPIPYIPNYETRALGLTKNILYQGIVVLPVNEKTTAWICQTIKNTPPEYPRAAYFQNNTH